MTEAVKNMLDFLLAREYRALRKKKLDFTEECKGLDGDELQICFLKNILNREAPLLYKGDVFGFNTNYRFAAKESGSNISEALPSNITVNYGRVIGQGFDQILETICEKKKTANQDQLRFYNGLETEISYILDFCERYRQEAQRVGNTRLAAALDRVPHKGARTLYEACVFQKLLIFLLRITHHKHLTLGRFDQYMYPYFKHDLENGVSREELLETVELFFIALNLDSDTYYGVQQGDNGQSMVLGGYDLDGNDQFNELSAICLDASLELSLIDPKINLRVSKKTPDERYEYGTKLTKKGLGFPQYCNDDVVIPGLIALGYAPEDAANYTVAACWEYIVPNCSVDVPNVKTFNFPLVINNAVHAALKQAETFEDLLKVVDEFIAEECKALIASCNTIETYTNGRKLKRSPLISVLVDGCIEKGVDAADRAAKYYNLGCHGAGIANAADALTAIQKLVYNEKKISADELLAAMNANFEGYAELRNLLLSAPKVGNDEDEADALMVHIMNTFSKELNGKPNGTGGVWRAGTGSAMEYIWSAEKCPATADGRLAGAPYGSSFSPAITTTLRGPLSTIQSFTKPDLTKTINGGPLTLEIHDNVFRNEESEKKVAALIKLFVWRGGHQLQLNAVNRDRLLDAQKHPEKYPNLIVRVWGWSGYFCELDREYQDHIISRTEFTL